MGWGGPDQHPLQGPMCLPRTKTSSRQNRILKKKCTANVSAQIKRKRHGQLLIKYRTSAPLTALLLRDWYHFCRLPENTRVLMHTGQWVTKIWPCIQPTSRPRRLLTGLPPLYRWHCVLEVPVGTMCSSITKSPPGSQNDNGTETLVWHPKSPPVDR